MANEYTGAQLLAMQRDAVRRVNEMQRIAKEKLAGQQEAQSSYAPRTPPPASSDIPEQSIAQPEHSEHSEQTEHSSAPPLLNFPFKFSGLTGFLDRMNLDEETIMLILMLLMLINDGADTMLILALGYILL